MDSNNCEVCNGTDDVRDVKGTDGEGAFTWSLCAFCREEVGGDE